VEVSDISFHRQKERKIAKKFKAKKVKFMTSIKVLIESVEVEHEGEKRERKERKGCDDQLPEIHDFG